MALAYNVIARGSFGDLFYRIVDLTLDAAYAAGGYSLSALSAGFGTNGTIVAIIPMGAAGGFHLEYNPATGKLRVRDSSGGVGAATPEAANNLAALNGVVARVMILGRGQG